MKKINQNALTVSGHIKELKKKVITIIFTFVISFIACLYFCNKTFDFILELGRTAGYEFIYISPQEIILQNIKISGILAIFVSLPIILYELASFISPIFNAKYVIMKILFLEIAGVSMFILGAIFAYKLLLPFTFTYLYSLGKNINVKAQISIGEYLSFLTTMVICIGTIFEIPLISVILTKLKVVNSKIMKSARSVIFVVIFVIAAIITPPDIVSQIMVAIPMVALYQISIFLCILIETTSKSKSKNKKNNNSNEG